MRLLPIYLPRVMGDADSILILVNASGTTRRHRAGIAAEVEKLRSDKATVAYYNQTVTSEPSYVGVPKTDAALMDIEDFDLVVHITDHDDASPATYDALQDRGICVVNLVIAMGSHFDCNPRCMTPRLGWRTSPLGALVA